MGVYLNAAHQKNCLTQPVVPSLMWGSGFSVVSVLQGARATPELFAINIGFLYAYSALQCPMEAFHGRQSLAHNVVAGGLVGSLGVQMGRLGIPLVEPAFFWRYPQITPPMAAFAVY